MASLTYERFALPGDGRSERALDRASARAAEHLGGRTVWCVSAVADGRRAASALYDCLRRTGVDAIVAASIDMPAAGPLLQLAERLEAMLTDAETASEPPLGPADDEVVDYAVSGAAEGFVAGMRTDDVVVLHDALTAALAGPVRERGAHAVWHVSTGTARRGAAVVQARRFLVRYTAPVDAYVASRRPSRVRGERFDRIAALMPCPDSITEKEVAHELDDLGWTGVLGDVVQTDRDETVGGSAIRDRRPATMSIQTASAPCPHTALIRSVVPRTPEGCEECLRTGSLGPPPPVPHLRPRGLLRLLAEPARATPRAHARPPDRPVLPARRGLALVLRGREVRLRREVVLDDRVSLRRQALLRLGQSRAVVVGDRQAHAVELRDARIGTALVVDGHLPDALDDASAAGKSLKIRSRTSDSSSRRQLAVLSSFTSTQIGLRPPRTSDSA